MKSLRFMWVPLAFSLAAYGQAVVESSILTGAGVGAATGARGAGSSAAGVFGRLNEILGASGKASGNTAAPVTKSAHTAQPAATTAAVVPTVPTSKPYVQQPIDASQVTVGLSRHDLIAKCGEPSIRTTGTRQSKSFETMYYTTSDKDELKVQLEDGVVSLIVSSRTAQASVQPR